MKTIRCLTFLFAVIAAIGMAVHFGFAATAAVLPAAASGFVCATVFPEPPELSVRR